ncbi:hypothetical protein AMQ84_00130, partial [Paenibacillus riograndensis]
MHEVSTSVIDEADQMIQLSGAGEVAKSVSSAQRSRQLVMVSATRGPERKERGAREVGKQGEGGIDRGVRTAEVHEPN